MNSEVLNTQFGIENSISFQPFEHTVIAELKTDCSTAKVSLYGAHVLSFIPDGQEDILFVSPHAVFQDGKAIRGGVPVCWPWFNAHPVDKSLPSHGFARTSSWQVVHTSANDQETCIELALYSNEQTLKLWPYEFEARLMIKLDHQLKIELTTFNKDIKAFDVSGALHSYFNVSDILNVQLQGLHGADYFDSVINASAVENNELLSFEQYTNRMYSSTQKCVIHDKNRTIEVDKSGSGMTVVWNPGEELANKMPDLLEGYKNMLCVEAANCLEDTITIQAGQKHTLSTTFG
ncbi:D-hexose-6-phosphate mutarotase [Carboxylicivirga sp. RSCT41]|uniref:D-hexose-6-phosphate mutarotase n=1 Tax=Carboxylicivirga agarovorans TaxID=3417570 RepID=UPI003D32AA66